MLRTSTRFPTIQKLPVFLAGCTIIETSSPSIRKAVGEVGRLVADSVRVKNARAHMSGTSDLHGAHDPELVIQQAAASKNRG